MLRALEGKVAVITGSGRGQGLAAARRFAAEGAAVIVNDLDETSVESATTTICQSGGRAAGVVGDVSDSEDVQRVLAVATENYGGLDILYLNAGIGYSARGRFGIEMANVVECSEDDWQRIIAINLGGVFLFCKYGIPLLKERGGGVILNTASMAALRGTPDAHAYTASKGAIVALTRALAVTYGPSGIRANVICPGLIDTDMVQESVTSNDAVHRTVVNRTPLRRLGRAEEVAELALFLVSDASQFITGQVLGIDGGMSA